MYVLYIVVDESLLEWYKEKVTSHNEKQTDLYSDSGFDLACPTDITVKPGPLFMDFKIKAAMYKNNTPSAYYLYPRSSISKTQFRLANSVGIIDRGYRGNIGAYFDCHHDSSIEKGQRLVQICSPTLEPFRIIVTYSLDITKRGENGFGSTGKI